MRTTLLIALFSAIMLTGCTSSEKIATELLDTARFEEKQNNREHAIKLYQEIIHKHPASAASKDAATRLSELESIKP